MQDAEIPPLQVDAASSPADPQNQLRKATSMVAETTCAEVLSHKTMPLVDMRAKLWGSRIKNICLWKQPSLF